LCHADHAPVHPVGAWTDVGFDRAALIIIPDRIPPAERGVVIVGTGINDAICRQAMRQVIVRALISKTELQHRHAGNLQALSQRVNFGRDVAEIFGEERQASQSFAKLVEEIVSGAIDPAAIYGSGLVRRNLPELIEAAEVIQADLVASFGGPAQTLHPPNESAGPHHVPVIKRIAPALAGGAECVWRNA